jgi:hypothetical protein
VGSNIFKKHMFQQGMSGYVSVSDEAMTFLILANNWDVWTEMAIDLAGQPDNNKKCKTVEECVSKQKYHIDGKGRGYSWSVEGKEYYNRMYMEIEKDRIINGKEFDAYFLKSMISDEMKKEEKRMEKRRGGISKEFVIHKVVRCKNDYVDDDEDPCININEPQAPTFDFTTVTSNVHQL